MYDVFIMDMGGHSNNVQELQARFPHARVTRYNHSHLATITRLMKRSHTRLSWILSSCCDYSMFDFEWEPPPWEEHQIHCWASGDQPLGDTFLIPGQIWDQQQPLVLLEWFRDINYHAQGVPRLPWPITHYNEMIATLSHTEFLAPYHWFLPEGIESTGTGSDPALWTEKHHQLVSFSRSNSISLVPSTAISQVKDQVYDFPNLVRVDQISEPQQDIVFISYDETNADENWNQLQQKYPQARRIHGIDGMENALRAAAQAADTEWFYAVFAKTRLHESWNFDHQPDRWQQPKHYIFYAHNTSNDLIYGEMGVIMYHRDTVIDAPPFDKLGVDFTMSFPTVVVPRISCYGDFATDPYRAWRTAFRECMKLAKWNNEEPCVETEYRLHVWQTHAHGEHAEWVLRGARDGAVYYAAFKHRHDALDAMKKTFRWEWLREYFLSLYPEMNSAI